jgi:glyoxylase-like metal-dependent hydrolase (beta-lactamase superfamily II)
MATVKLYVLSSGLLWAEKGFLFNFGTQEDTGEKYEPESVAGISCQYFIDHSDAKILFDLGWNMEDFSKLKGFPQRENEDGKEIEQAPDENPKSQLEKIGVSIDEIDYVVISHLMAEHAGWLPLFREKKARIIVQKKELEYAYANKDRSRFAPEPFHSWMYWSRHFDHPDLNYELVEGDRELVDGVQIMHTPGHTPGYQIMKVRLQKSGPIVLSACETWHNYYGVGVNAVAPGIPHCFSYSYGDELRNFRKIKQIVGEEKGQIFFGHDYKQFQTLKKVPEYYD